MAWKIGLTSLVLAILTTFGCQQQTFLTEADYHAYRDLALPPCLEESEQIKGIVPSAGNVPPPMTVDDTQRKPRYLSLREAIAIALERGTIGVQSPDLPGMAVDTLGGFAGRAIVSSDGIRVLAFDPAILANDIEISLSKFDTLWNASFNWSRTETPVGTSPLFAAGGGSVVLGGGTGGLGAAGASIASDQVAFNTGLIKPLPTGGVAGITFNLTRDRSQPHSAIDPVYQPQIQFTFEQPLLQGFGEEINQLRPNHPGSLLTPFSTALPVEGILITRIRLDQQKAEFERNINYLLLNVEAAYWNLYGAYYNLYAREEGLRYTYEYWRLTRALFENGRTPIQTLEQIRLQYEQFRGQRLTALGQVLESERQLRSLLGLPIEDGCRLVPVDAPVLAPVKPDWRAALDEALARRPELFIARQDLKFRQLDLIRVKNDLLPDLRFVASDTIHSVGSELGGGRDPSNAFHNLDTDPFNNFSMGLRMTVPIGFRFAHAEVRDAKLELQRSYVNLITEEDKAQRYLGLAYRQLQEFQDQIQIQKAALEAATGQLQGYYELFQQGRAAASDANLILALQNYANSVASYYAAIVQYNNALATFEFGKGTIMEHDDVFIAEGTLPHCAQVRAVEHERQRTEAIVLSETSGTVVPASCPPAGWVGPKVAHLATETPLPVPALEHERQPVPEIPHEPVSATAVLAVPDNMAAPAKP
jgi:outer membrane protein TolC